MFKNPGGEHSHYIQYVDDNMLILCGDFKKVIPMLHLCIDGKFEPTLIVTDPPYEFQSKGGGLYKESESMDKIRDLGTDSFDFKNNIPMLTNWQERYTGYVNGYFFCNKSLIPNYIEMASKSNGWTFDILILDRLVSPPAHNNHYMSHIEYAMFLRKPGDIKPPFNGSLDLWKGMYRKIFQWTGGKTSDHANEKPVAMMKQYIEISSMPGDIVIDPFMGSGTTGVAAKECGRKFIGIEITPEYAQTAIARLSQYSLF
jgi:site-specific DNA-methyltransferase (adenine-specific)